ncbi:hypothetical protein [Microbispora rosea]|uniref:hypothetical protein n=1 Tax=Microbispora rosea TaxID=58117 RepID=UPI003D94994F
MTNGSALGTGALLAVAATPSLPWFIAAWMLAGVAQSALLYPPAFAALTRWYGPDRIRPLATCGFPGGQPNRARPQITEQPDDGFPRIRRLAW